ncbi:Mitochondrial distribution and morphology protein 31, mitochondrial precursor [Irineochytrium annulatum]|nr:Mitochondrial distribution and morphology protein 31, mitochondrial precursor [Irineochytrium annulatum]
MIRLTNVSVVCTGDTWIKRKEKEFSESGKDAFDPSKVDLNWTYWDLNIKAVDVTLSLWRWLEGKGVINECRMKGARGVVDRRHVSWDPNWVPCRRKPLPGDFEMDKFIVEDLLLTILNPNFRPFTVSVFHGELPLFRQQWLLVHKPQDSEVFSDTDERSSFLNLWRSDRSLKSVENWAKMTNFDGAWTFHSAGIVDLFGEEIGRALTSTVLSERERTHHLKRVGIWNIQSIAKNMVAAMDYVRGIRAFEFLLGMEDLRIDDAELEELEDDDAEVDVDDDGFPEFDPRAMSNSRQPMFDNENMTSFGSDSFAAYTANASNILNLSVESVEESLDRNGSFSGDYRILDGQRPDKSPLEESALDEEEEEEEPSAEALRRIVSSFHGSGSPADAKTQFVEPLRTPSNRAATQDTVDGSYYGEEVEDTGDHGTSSFHDILVEAMNECQTLRFANGNLCKEVDALKSDIGSKLNFGLVSNLMQMYETSRFMSLMNGYVCIRSNLRFGNISQASESDLRSKLSSEAARSLNLEAQVHGLRQELNTLRQSQQDMSSIRETLKMEKDFDVLTIKKELTLQKERELEEARREFAAFKEEQQRKAEEEMSLKRRLSASENERLHDEIYAKDKEIDALRRIRDDRERREAAAHSSMAEMMAFSSKIRRIFDFGDSGDLSTLCENYESEARQLKESLSRELLHRDDAIRALQDKVLELEAAVATSKADIEDEHRLSLAALRKSHESEKKALVASYDAQIANLTKANDGGVNYGWLSDVSLGKLMSLCPAQFSLYKKSIEASLSKYVEAVHLQYDAEMSGMKEKFDVEKQAWADLHEQKINEITESLRMQCGAAYSAAIKKLRNDYSRLQRRRYECEEPRSEIAALEDKLESLKTALESATRDHEAQMVRVRDECKAYYSEQLRIESIRLREKYERKLFGAKGLRGTTEV